MKALKSKLASQLLADPVASEQLRQFLTNQSTPSTARQNTVSGEFVIRGDNGLVRVQATMVPKAAKAA
jgi:hypothetical protein